jgi:hypothetical protein
VFALLFLVASVMYGGYKIGQRAAEITVGVIVWIAPPKPPTEALEKQRPRPPVALERHTPDGIDGTRLPNDL